MGNAELVFELEILCPKWAEVETLLGLAVLQKQRGGGGVGRGSVIPAVDCGFSLFKTKQSKTPVRPQQGWWVSFASDSFLTYLNLR